MEVIRLSGTPAATALFYVMKTSVLTSNPPSDGSGGTSDWNSVSGLLLRTGGGMTITDKELASSSNVFYKTEVTRP